MLVSFLLIKLAKWILVVKDKSAKQDLREQTGRQAVINTDVL